MTTGATVSTVRLSSRARAAGDAPITWLMVKALQVPGMISLAAGFVDRESLPHAEMERIVSDLLADPQAGRDALQYGTTAGDPALRAALLERVRSEAPVWSSVEADDVVVTGGSQQLLYLLGEVLLEPGDIVLVENPSYFVYVGALESFGARVVGVETDAEGLQPAALDRALRQIEAEGDLSRVRMVYVMSYSQNPMGVSLSAERRPQLLRVFEDWIERGADAVLVEDAAYRDVRFPEVGDLPPLFELQESNSRVCYLESFSKVLSPGLRLGFGVLPFELREAVLRIKSHHDFGTSNLAQQILRRALSSGLVDRHVVDLREVYRRKHDVLAGALTEELGDTVELVEPSGGLYVWMTMRDDLTTGEDSALFERALSEKVIYVPGAVCSVPTGDPSGRCARSMRLCYAYPSDEDLVEGARRLGRAVRAVRK